jgi:shikimate dehydrogenase
VTADQVTRCAVLGSPIAHSLSPQLHRAAYGALGLDWEYERFEVSAEGLPDFVAGLDSSWRGLSLTMPLKEAVLGLGEVEPVARLAGAGNTLILGERRSVYNTDVSGLAWAVRRVTAGPVPRVTILGSGATARSAVVALTELAADGVAIVARNPAKAESLAGLARELGLQARVQAWGSALPPADLVVSAAIAGAVDPMVEEVAASAPVVLDIVYAPWPTPLARAAEQAGRTVIGGLELLVGQALRQIQLMTGRSVPAEVLFAALPESRGSLAAT